MGCDQLKKFFRFNVKICLLNPTNFLRFNKEIKNIAVDAKKG